MLGRRHSESPNDNRENRGWSVRACARSSRARLSRLIAAACLALAIPWPLGAAPAANVATTYARPVFPEQTTRVGDLCISFSAVMTAGDFFLNLQKVESSGKTEFREGDQVVKYFPAQLAVVVLAHPRACDCTAHCESLDPESRRYLGELRFDVRWKNGLDETPVKSFTVAKPEDEIQKFPVTQGGPAIAVDMWKYPIAVAAQDNVPLETHLIVSIFDDRRNMVARLSGALEGAGDAAR